MMKKPPPPHCHSRIIASYTNKRDFMTRAQKVLFLYSTSASRPMMMASVRSSTFVRHVSMKAAAFQSSFTAIQV